MNLDLDFKVKKPTDIKLNVQPIMYGIVHDMVFEGPCRFGAGDGLTHDAELMKFKELKKDFQKQLEEVCDPSMVNLLPMAEVIRDETFPLKEEIIDQAAGENPQDVDFYIFGNFGFGIDFVLEFVRKYQKPIAYMEFCCGNTSATAALWARGYEAYVFETPMDAMHTFRILRARKAIENTKVLLVTRGAGAAHGTMSLSAQDSFINLEDVTDRLGTKFRSIDLHEFADQMHPYPGPRESTPEGGNHTLPGREVCNITPEDQAIIDAMTDELLDNAVYNAMEWKEAEPSVRAHFLTRKLLEAFECNAFTAPCPDMCATRRLNQDHYTMCLNHSLNNSCGICSACEYDISALLSMEFLMNLSFSAPYMGNTAVATYKKGEPVAPMVPLINMQYKPGEVEKMVEDIENVVYTFHSTPPLKINGFDTDDIEYGINSFAFSGWGTTIRYDFAKDAGKTVTMCRFDPTCSKIFICKGTIVGGMGYKAKNCSEGVFFQVADTHRFLQCAGQVGNHIPLVYGDWYDDAKELAAAFGLEVIEL